MRNKIILASLVLFPLLFLGCTKKAANSSEAIRQAEAMQTPKQKTNYLLEQANAFLKDKNYNDAVDSAQYVLSRLDKNSRPAMDILDKAKAGLSESAKGMMQNISNTTSRMFE
ncbi:MAG TPA: hypothetical protein PLU24_02095 [Candidatus Omnitrophota bacterium]|nr:hypothetical protein [Candidatus Omnitrophota bacterium]